MTKQWGGDCFYRVSLKALIRNEKGQILLVSENNGDISLPGGGLDNDETAHECLKRELYEEIALTSDFKEKLIHQQVKYLPHRNKWLMWLTYEIDYEKLEFSIGEDGEEVMWLYEKDIEIDIDSGLMIANVLNDNNLWIK